ncbi:hypothetical protein PCCS19_08850 [Paenibacillus sp. CCS19]|nr:hypothetical protein PCCS19_08850 [Paenibacillus cellulosilyticus]
MTSAVANAATTKTSADFSDLASLDAATKAKFDALLAAGIFEGNGTATFGLKEEMNRAQFAKVAALIFGLKVNGTQTSSFSDVGGDNGNGWAIPYIEAAKKAGIINGRPDGSFDPGAPVTIAEFATAMLRGLGAKPDLSGKPWYADAVKQAVDSKLIPAGLDPKQQATRGDFVNTSSDFIKNKDEIKKKLDELLNNNNGEDNGGKDDETKEPEGNNNNNTTTPTIPSTPSDTTAPTITGATIEGRSVTLTGGTSGTISFQSDKFLTQGTISVSEASTLTVTAVEGVTLTDYASLSTSQSLSAGSNSLNLITLLGSLDANSNGVGVAKLAQLDSDHNGLVISGTLRDNAGNSSNVTLTIKADDTKPNLTAATINGSAVTINNNTGSFALAADAYLKTGTITADENAAFKVTGIEGIGDLTAYPALTYSKDLKAGTAESLDLAEFLGGADAQANGLSVSQLKVLTGQTNSVVLTGTLTDEAGNVREVSLTLTLG